MKLFPLKIILSALLLMSVLVWARLMTASHAQTMKDLGCTTITTIPPSIECENAPYQPLIFDTELGQPGPSIDRAIEHDSVSREPANLLLTQEQLTQLQESVHSNYGGSLRVQLIDPPCLAQMEAAMRAMDRWIAWNPAQVDAMKSWMDTPFMNTQRHEAIHAWESTKRACWRQP